MAAMIKGIPVVLYVKTQTGVDGFNAPVYGEAPETVENVLVTPVSAGDAADAILPGTGRAEYELCIPKGDAHTWEGCTAQFFGERWRVIGLPQEWIAQNVPLDWNRKVKVERYG